jgi:hypothetical protein
LLEPILTPGDDARRILPTVLHYRQAVIESLIDRVPANYSDNAAHASLRECHQSPEKIKASGIRTGSTSAGSSGVSKS